MELALYAPASGFFATHGGAGRRGGDFITSPEVGPLFGAVIARRLDALWESAGQPERFTVIEVGAGRGALAIAVLAAGPRCRGSLHWVMVERSASLRAAASEHLDIVDVPDARTEGPWVTSAPVMGGDAGDAAVRHAVIANELLDNLPFRLMERVDGSWSEVFVSPGMESPDHPGGPALIETLVETPDDVGARLDDLVPEAPLGARVPLQEEAHTWVTSALDRVGGGMVLAFDYCEHTPSLALRAQSEWLRTYRSHERGGPVLELPGSQDITVDVAIDQLPAPTVVATQADWLRVNGLDDLVSEARAHWVEHAGVGNLAAVRARSAVLEAEALCDPSGLGGFTAMEWHAE